MLVRRAGADIVDVLDKYRVEQTTDDVQMLGLVLALQHDAYTAVRGDKDVAHVGEMAGLDDAIRRARDGNRLTPIELLRILIEYGEALTRLLLRLERHPDNPDRRADEE